MCDDRLVGGRLVIAHEYLGVMLGVRRPGVTVALQVIEGRGLIQSRRGEVVISDRKGLINLANGSYGDSEAEYRRVVGEIEIQPQIVPQRELSL
ncbi:helix-turn-helix domain-containing protein [Mesorhizobium caraganae]|uniref:helix-turn-helix domain-containing protein n=1 Tax=Mesorhizobium caraganae TaxID=483206 RepID=UPI003339E2DC